MFAADLDCLEESRQTGRGEQHLGRNFGVAEDPASASVHVRCGDEEFDGTRDGRTKSTDEARISESGLDPTAPRPYGEKTWTSCPRQ
jgi:hypothetical protein